MADANTKSILKLIATTSDKIKNLIIENGQLIFIRDLGRIAFDFKGKRTYYNQIVELNTEAERLALESPLSGYYFVIDEACLWFYQDKWTQITSKPQQILFVGTEIPALGEKNKIYVDINNKEISVWDDKTEQYVTVSNYIEEISESDIEDLFD